MILSITAIITFTRPAVLYIKNTQRYVFYTCNVQYTHWQGRMYILRISKVLVDTFVYHRAWESEAVGGVALGSEFCGSIS